MPAGLVRLRWLLPEAADAAQLAAWHATLDAAERDRAERFRFEADRRAFLAAHALARAMLAEAAGLPAAALRFVAGRAGKPELDPALGLPWLRFNLSHTRSLVACALACRDDLGLDVEDLARPEASPGLAGRFFAPPEAAAIAALPPAERHRAFLRIWTLKEAFVKATGDGLGLGLDRFAFTLDPAPRLAFAPGSAGDPGEWRFVQVQPTPRHVLAMALRRRAG
jgi:4'-phosphopantetheinyl transferase